MDCMNAFTPSMSNINTSWVTGSTRVCDDLYSNTNGSVLGAYLVCNGRGTEPGVQQDCSNVLCALLV